jgi:hypothetical protein
MVAQKRKRVGDTFCRFTLWKACKSVSCQVSRFMSPQKYNTSHAGKVSVGERVQLIHGTKCNPVELTSQHTNSCYCKVLCRSVYAQLTYVFVSLLPLFWKIEVSLCYHHAVYVSVYPLYYHVSAWTNLYENGIYIMAPKPISTASPYSVYPLSSLGNGSIKTLPHNSRRIFEGVVFDAVRVVSRKVCDLYFPELFI